MATMKDPEFLADAAKARLAINPMSGKEVESIVQGFFSLDSSLVGKLREVLVGSDERALGLLQRCAEAGADSQFR
jgi:hypothetical protein